jgi:glutaryl-CoA dehydrogenase
MSASSYAKVITLLCETWMSLAGIINTHMMLGQLITRFGTEDQKERFLARLAAGELHGALCLTEPDAGTDLQGIKTVARRDGDDYVLNGAKMWITNGTIADAAIVWAKTEEGIKGFIVEKDMPGFTAQEIENKFSLRASITAGLFFDNVRVPEANVLPGVNSLRGPLSCLTQARYGITWGVIGAAQACLHEVLAFTQDRILFGQPLASNQAVQIRLADMSRRITTAQLLSLRLARIKEAGKLSPTQVSLAKWNNCRAAIDIARDARDLLGGAGISAEFVSIRHMLNLESVITYEGTETIHQLSVGRELTGINAFV